MYSASNKAEGYIRKARVCYCKKSRWNSIKTNMKKASLFCWLILVVVWSRVLCSEVYLVGSEKTHICEVSFSAD